MQIAQQMYEGIELPSEGSVGLITYMRTDSTRVSEQSLGEVRQHIETAFGAGYLPAQANRYPAPEGRPGCARGHRPTSAERTPESVRAHLSAEQFTCTD